ncbi:MAG: hypothetical protein HND47_08585 [Chloroflexi bacterium]|nr:hypothetical protein [Chloroflexota bacterium]
MRWIYLSPHLDDAALSAGGWVYDQTLTGSPVEIWTIMCGYPPTTDLSPFAQVLHLDWGIPDAEQVVRNRRLEEERAANVLGAQTRYFDFLDCIYRQSETGEWLYSGIFVDPHPDEADLPARIAQAVSARLKPDDKLVCQLGVGRHVGPRPRAPRRGIDRASPPLRGGYSVPIQDAGRSPSAHGWDEGKNSNGQQSRLEVMGGGGGAVRVPNPQPVQQSRRDAGTNPTLLL